MAKNSETGYSYFRSGSAGGVSGNSRRLAIELGRERADPSSSNPDQVILQERRRYFEEWLGRLPDRKLDVLDIGGRIQPYRDILGDRVNSYTAVDPQLAGLANVVAVGESLPFLDSVFDFAICTQVLTYASDPAALIHETRRVLKWHGALFLTAPAFFPEHHDECWRFLPAGLRKMFNDWHDVDIAPEGGSAVGVLRNMGVALNANTGSRVKSFISTRLAIPGINFISARFLGKYANTSMTANYSVWATK